jgi:SAM-dependent methyltransferase
VERQLQNIEAFLRDDRTFLHVGPGDCALTLEAARYVKRAYAVDVSSEITKGLEAPPNFALILSDGVSIPVPPGSVDVAYSDQLMEHLHPDDASDQLKNIYEALAPGGVYFCITPNRLNGPHDISCFFDRVATGLHLKEYTVTELGRLFRETGFSRVRAFIRLGRLRIFFPPAPIEWCEGFLSALPYGPRKRIASSVPMRLLLGVRLVGTK